MMSHLETLKITKFIPSTQNLIQKKNPLTYEMTENCNKVTMKIYSPLNLENRVMSVCGFDMMKVMHQGKTFNIVYYKHIVIINNNRCNTVCLG